MEQLYLLELIFMRLIGFAVLTPLLGRGGIPTMVRTGFAVVLSWFVFSCTNTTVSTPSTTVEYVLQLVLELGVGLVLGFIMQITFSVVQVGGELIDNQMGMTMAQIYDAGSQANMTVTASLLNILLVLNFFAENGHYTMMRIILASEKVVPFGQVILGTATAEYILEIFGSCMILAVKLAMPVLAAELLGEISMGILMKAIPQINAFVINMELKVIVGMVVLFFMLNPISEFLLEIESGMLNQFGRALQLLGGAA